MIIRGIARVADVDLCVLRDEDPGDVPSDLPVSRLLQGPAPHFVRSLGTQSSWLVRPTRTPSELTGLESGPTREILRSWVTATGARYDAVWYDRPLAFLVAGAIDRAGSIVDFDDLEDRKLGDRLRLEGLEQGTWGGPPIPGWRHVARFKTRRNVTGWQRLQASIAHQADFVTVCSHEDARVLGQPNAVVVPNAYPLVSNPLGRLVVARPPTLTFVGLLTYRPNQDAVQWFVTEVLPLVRREIPDVELRIVGRASAAVAALESLPGVTVTGRVDRIEDELARADASIAPIRFGGGTRLKILEAWAHRIPVVSTSVGAEGLGVVHGTHALIADGASEFAQECVLILSDETTRARLAERGAERVASHFSMERSESLVAQLIRDATTKPGDRPTRGFTNDLS